MTVEEFYAELAKTKNDFKWQFDGGAIRGICNGDRYCPITAVWKIKSAKYVPTLYWSGAANWLGLDSYFAYNIVNAADNYSKTEMRVSLEKALF